MICAVHGITMPSTDMMKAEDKQICVCSAGVTVRVQENVHD